MSTNRREDTDSRLADEFRNGTLETMSVEYFLEHVIRTLKPVGRYQRQEAQDIALATLEEVYISIHTYRGKSAFFTWVTTIALRVAHDHRKREGKIEIIPEEIMQTGFPFQSDDAEKRIIHETQVRERQEDEIRLRRWSLRDALNSLGESERRLVELRIDQGLSLSEIGGHLGVSADAIQHRLARIWAKLRNHLDDSKSCDGNHSQ